MRLCLINPSNPLVSSVNVNESRWNRYRVWKPLSLMVLGGLTPPDREIIREMLACNQRFYSLARILRRAWNSFWHRRHPLFSLRGNLSHRSNIRVDCQSYADFKHDRCNPLGPSPSNRHLRS